MSANSKIEWTDHTFNPWIGCTKVSPGCANCYAERREDHRLHRVKWGKGQPRHRTKTWGDPVKWNRDLAQHNEEHGDNQRARVFCASLADILDDEVPIEWLADLLELIRTTPNLDWLLLTKRPKNWRERIVRACHVAATGTQHGAAALCHAWLSGHAPANVWLGVSVEDQTRADERIPLLLGIPARIRFLSCEPLLGPVDLNASEPRGWAWSDPNFTDDGAKPGGIHWVIVGGESGSHARPMHPAWARSLRDQCATAGVAFHFKQWGEWRPWAGETDVPRWVGEAGEFEDAPMLWVGKRTAGRLLDGREHNQWPEDFRVREFPAVQGSPGEASANEAGGAVGPQAPSALAAGCPPAQDQS